jgi:antitoxin FitA
MHKAASQTEADKNVISDEPGRDPGIDMCSTCNYVDDMPVMIQIRNVPNDLHRRLKARAALAGMSLSDYLLGEIRQVAERPTVEELRARLAGRTPVNPSVSPAKAVRAERDSR